MDQIQRASEKMHPTTSHVYYFSGTGNSYHAAKTIAGRIGAVLAPIVSLRRDAEIDADILCFVFPAYDFKPPKKVTDILENLKSIHANQTIAVGTYGVALFSTLQYMKKTLLKKNVVLSSGYGIKLPHNAVGSIGFTDEENAKRILEADIKISAITEDIRARKVNGIEKGSILEGVTLVRQFPLIARFLSLLIVKGPKSFELTVTPDCVGCRQCGRICPVKNIEWVNERPQFGDRCTSCFACLQWCPKAAIHFGPYGFKTMCMKHYHHPAVKAADLFVESYAENE